MQKVLIYPESIHRCGTNGH